MSQFDCLSTELSLWGHHFVEASAGTGKTFAIEHVVIRLLLDDRDVKIDQILIVTFTRAATRELKSRIQCRIRETIQAIETKTAIYPYLKEVIDRSDSQRSKQRLELALSCFDTAQIFTIHGFCHRMLNEYGLEAGLFIDGDVQERNGYPLFVEKQIKDVLRSEKVSQQFSPGQIKTAMRFCGGQLDGLIRKLQAGLGKDKGGGASFKESLSVTNHKLHALPSYSFEQLAEAFSVVIRDYRGLCDRQNNLLPFVEEQVHHLSQAIANKKMTFEQLEALLKGKHLFLSQLIDDHRKKKTRADEKQIRLVESLQQSLLQSIEPARDPKCILGRLAQLCSERIQHAKQVYDVLSPDDVLVLMLQALQDESFCQKLREKFQAVIVDEFQDTDPIQWDIFNKLFVETPANALYLVGDPKQSIYAFRNADLYTYLSAKQQVGQVQFLSTNYRSSLALTNSLNRLFQHENVKGWLYLPALDTSIDYRPSKSPGTNEAVQWNDKKSALHLFLFNDPKARSLPSKGIEQTILFPYIAKEILSHTENEHGRIAVLIKDRFQAARLQTFFKEVGIHSQCTSALSVCQTQAFILMDVLLKAMLSPSNRSNIRRLLACPLLAIEYTKLFDPTFIDAISVSLHELKFRWQNEGLGSVLDQVLHWMIDGQKLLTYLTQHSKGQDYIDWMQLCELLLAEEAQNICKPKDSLAFIQKIELLSPDLHPELRRRSCYDDSTVSILTTHMSKGLEFDIVFALGMGCRTPTAEYCPEKEAEKMRLFYVALTRAKYRVYVPLLTTQGKEPVAGTASPSELFFSKFCQPLTESLAKEIGERHLSLEILDQPITVSKAVRKPTPDLTPPQAHGLHYTPTVLTSYSKLVKTKNLPVLAPPIDSDTCNLYTLPMGSQTGIVLHELIEAVIERGYYRCKHLAKLDLFIEKHLKKTHLFFWKEPIKDLVRCIFHLSIDGFYLKDIPQHAITQEMEFLFPLEPSLVVKGFVDLIFQHQGKYYLIDWKSNYLGDTPEHYDQIHLEQAMQEHDYHLQARLYSSALLKWIGAGETAAPKDLFGGAVYIFLRGISNEDTHGMYIRRFE